MSSSWPKGFQTNIPNQSTCDETLPRITVDGLPLPLGFRDFQQAMFLNGNSQGSATRPPGASLAREQRHEDLEGCQQTFLILNLPGQRRYGIGTTGWGCLTMGDGLMLRSENHIDLAGVDLFVYCVRWVRQDAKHSPWTPGRHLHEDPSPKTLQEPRIWWSLDASAQGGIFNIEQV